MASTAFSNAEPRPLSLGVLALQGAFSEHQYSLATQPGPVYHLTAIQTVRTAAELATVDGLIIPGGESTTMALIAERSGLWEPLVEFTRTKPTWGTCAGMVLLAQTASGAKRGGQKLLGSMATHVQRNRFGSQLDSFEVELDAPCLAPFDRPATGEEGPLVDVIPFRAVFIRAPVVTEWDSVLVQVLAEIPPSASPSTVAEPVAVLQGLCLATAFHPELTQDHRWHQFFLSLVARQQTSLGPS
ncbi:PdxT/SNO family [Dimargaris cristalligena]|uniref:glutaminase n=1 Tax=Dimargaris cristalligena TaxID=215637 RepID=A0A4P9ZUT5_9FUNG|nr:PdxT/SNO family [Dimargaris cristalligena]|eukprot:RKP36572.1 PdxT/SNO family [Dimargaris cristalligena]